MLREIIRPTRGSFNFNIPKEYINKEIEVIVFPHEYNKEISCKDNENFDPKEFYGAGNATKEECNQYLNSLNNEWETK